MVRCEFSEQSFAWLLRYWSIGFSMEAGLRMVSSESKGMAAKSSGWSFRGLFRTKTATPAQSTPAPSPYHAVSILPGEHACGAAYRFTGHRFLSRQAPKLPLPTCDAFHCECRFKHHKDRRAGPRRRNDIGLMSGRYPGDERRRQGGRRASDN
jgi:hypothetical protein